MPTSGPTILIDLRELLLSPHFREMIALLQDAGEGAAEAIIKPLVKPITLING